MRSCGGGYVTGEALDHENDKQINDMSRSRSRTDGLVQPAADRTVRTLCAADSSRVSNPENLWGVFGFEIWLSIPENTFGFGFRPYPGAQNAEVPRIELIIHLSGVVKWIHGLSPSPVTFSPHTFHLSYPHLSPVRCIHDLTTVRCILLFSL